MSEADLQAVEALAAVTLAERAEERGTGRTNLGESGAVADFNYKKKPLVRAGDKTLPERVLLYNVQTGDVSAVPPTIAVSRMRRNPDIFTVRRPKDWDKMVPQPIPETCDICAARGGKKKFMTYYDLDAHYESFHPREFASRQRAEDREQRRQSDDRLATLIEMLVKQMGKS